MEPFPLDRRAEVQRDHGNATVSGQRQYHDKHVKDDLPVLLPGDPVRMAPFPFPVERIVSLSV